MPQSKIQSALFLPKVGSLPWANSKFNTGGLPLPDPNGPTSYVNGKAVTLGGVDLAGYAARDSYLAYRDNVLALAVEQVARRASLTFGTKSSFPTTPASRPDATPRTREVYISSEKSAVSLGLLNASSESSKHVSQNGVIAVTSEGSGGFRIWRLNSGTPVLSCKYSDVQAIQSALVGDKLFVLSSNQNLYVFNAAEPQNPVLLSKIALGAQFNFVASADDYVIVVAQNGTGKMFDSSTLGLSASFTLLCWDDEDGWHPLGGTGIFECFSAVSTAQSDGSTKRHLVAGVSFNGNPIYGNNNLTLSYDFTDPSNLNSTYGSGQVVPVTHGTWASKGVCSSEGSIFTVGKAYGGGSKVYKYQFDSSASDSGVIISSSSQAISGNSIAADGGYLVVGSNGGNYFSVVDATTLNVVSQGQFTFPVAQDEFNFCSMGALPGYILVASKSHGVQFLASGYSPKSTDYGDEWRSVTVARQSLSTSENAVDNGFGLVSKGGKILGGAIDYVAGTLSLSLVPQENPYVIIVSWSSNFLLETFAQNTPWTVVDAYDTGYGGIYNWNENTQRYEMGGRYIAWDSTSSQWQLVGGSYTWVYQDSNKIFVNFVPGDQPSYSASKASSSSIVNTGVVSHVDSGDVPSKAAEVDSQLYVRDLVLYYVLSAADGIFQKMSSRGLVQDSTLAPYAINGVSDSWSTAKASQSVSTALDSKRWSRETFRTPDTNLAYRDNVIARYVAELSGQLSSFSEDQSELLAICTEDGQDILAENPKFLKIGTWYTISSYSQGDDFTAVGAARNAQYETFYATGTLPTVWTNSSLVPTLSTESDSKFIVSGADISDSNGFYYPVVGEYAITWQNSNGWQLYLNRYYDEDQPVEYTWFIVAPGASTPTYTRSDYSRVQPPAVGIWSIGGITPPAVNYVAVPKGAEDEKNVILPGDRALITEDPVWKKTSVGDWAPIRYAGRIQALVRDSATENRLAGDKTVIGISTGTSDLAVMGVLSSWSGDSLDVSALAGLSTQQWIDLGWDSISSRLHKKVYGTVSVYHLSVASTGVGDPSWTNSNLENDLAELQESLSQSGTEWNILCTSVPAYSSPGATLSPGLVALRSPFEDWGLDAVISSGPQCYERFSVNGLSYINLGSNVSDTFTGTSDESVAKYDATNSVTSKQLISVGRLAIKLSATADGFFLELYSVSQFMNTYLLDRSVSWATSSRKLLYGTDLPEQLDNGWSWRDVEYYQASDGSWTPLSFNRDPQVFVKFLDTPQLARFGSQSGDVIEYDKGLNLVSWKPGGVPVHQPQNLSPTISVRPGAYLQLASGELGNPDLEGLRQIAALLPGTASERTVYLSKSFEAPVPAEAEGTNLPQAFNASNLVAGYPLSLEIDKLAKPKSRWYQMCALVEPTSEWYLRPSLSDATYTNVQTAGESVTLSTKGDSVGWVVDLPAGSYSITFNWSVESYSTDNVQTVKAYWGGNLIWSGQLLSPSGISLIGSFTNSGGASSFCLKLDSSAPGVKLSGIKFERLDLPESPSYTISLELGSSVSDTITFSGQAGVPQIVRSRWIDSDQFTGFSNETLKISLSSSPSLTLALRAVELKTLFRLSNLPQLSPFTTTRKKILEDALGNLAAAWRQSVSAATPVGTVWTSESLATWVSSLAESEPRLQGAFRDFRPGDLGRPALVPAGLAWDGSKLTQGLPYAETVPTLAPWEAWMSSYGILTVSEEFWDSELPEQVAAVYVLDPTGEDVDWQAEGVPTADFSQQSDSVYIPLL